jgi:hypothetical protein
MVVTGRRPSSLWWISLLAVSYYVPFLSQAFIERRGDLSSFTRVARRNRIPNCTLLRVSDYSPSTSTAPSILAKAGGILYKTSVFSRDEYATISKEVKSFSNTLRDETASSVAQHRLGTVLPKDSPALGIFRSGSLSRLVEQVSGQDDMNDYELSLDIPVEIRVYEKTGACMAWHVDTVLYDPPQVELIWTLENTSDCVTMWKDSDDNVRSVETDRNSAILLQAGGPSHCVTSLKRGRRTIVKCAFVQKGSIYQEGLHKDQFGPTQKKKGKRRKR